MSVGKLPYVGHSVCYLSAYRIVECKRSIAADMFLYVHYNASELIQGFGGLRV